MRIWQGVVGRRLYLIGSVSFVLGFAYFSGSAGAATVADVVDPIGDNGQSFDTAPTDLARVNISWDGGALTVSATYTAPTFGRLSLLVADGVSVDRKRRCDTYAPDQLEIHATTSSAELTTPEVDGRLTASGTWQGNTVTFVFSSPALADTLRDEYALTCVSGSTDGDRVFGRFAGKLLKITPDDATHALRDLLARRFGSAFKHSRRRWLRCPKQQIFPPTDESYAGLLCNFEFRLRSGRWRYRGGSVLLELIGGRLQSSSFRSRRYTKKLRSCRIPRTKGGYVKGVALTDRKLRASGALRPCRRLVGGAGIANDLQFAAVDRYPRPLPRRYRLYTHGTNTLGFQDQYIYRCHIVRRGLRYSARCSNRLHDKFVYSFTLVSRTAPLPQRPRSRPTCDPNYTGACLKPNVTDYDCAGGEGNGPNYVRGPIRVVGDDHYGLDSDGDGVACE